MVIATEFSDITIVIVHVLNKQSKLARLFFQLQTCINIFYKVLTLQYQVFSSQYPV